MPATPRVSDTPWLSACHPHLPTPPDTDAALAKMRLNWRTALILAELELEIEALAQGRQHRARLKVHLLSWVEGGGGEGQRW